MPLDNAGPAWLFCPADRPERFEKAAAAADIVILDLEDGAGDKPAAREALVSTPLNPARTVVRINPAGTDGAAAGPRGARAHRYTTVMLPKCESAEQVTALAPLEVVLIVETPLGALKVDETARRGQRGRRHVGRRGPVRIPGRYRQPLRRRLLSRRRQVRTFAVAAGREGATASRRWIRCTSTSRISTACGSRSTTPSRSASTSRWPSIPARWRSSGRAMHPRQTRSSGRDTFSPQRPTNGVPSLSRA